MAQPDIYGQLPPELLGDQRALERQQQIADAMMQQGMSPLGPGRMVGNTFVAPHWMEGVAKLGQAFAGNMVGGRVDQGRSDLARKAQGIDTDRTNAVVSAMMGSAPRPQAMSPEDIANAADQGDNPMPMMQDTKGDKDAAMQLGLQAPKGSAARMIAESLLAQKLKADEPFTLAPGASRVVGNQITLTAPNKPPLEKAFKVGDTRQMRVGRTIQTQEYQGPERGWVKIAEGEVDKPVSVTNSGGTPYSIPVPTPDGIMSFNTRTGTLSQPTMNGAPAVRAQDDPTLQGKIAASKKSGQEGADFNAKQYEAATSAAANIKNIDALINHIDSSQAITGMGADLLKNVERAKALFGSKAAAGKVKDTEILDIMMGSEVFPMIKSLGIGARGMDTPAEREFMRKVLTGEISLNKDTLRQMAQIRKDVAVRTIDNFNKRVDAGELDTYFNANSMKRQRINGGSQGGGASKSDVDAALAKYGPKQ